jgi:hypothetical protein
MFFVGKYKINVTETSKDQCELQASIHTVDAKCALSANHTASRKA